MAEMQHTKRQNDSECHQQQTKLRKLINPDSKSDSSDLKFLATVKAFIVKAGIENARMQIFKSQLQKYGGEVCPIFNNDVTHLIVDDKMDAVRLKRILNIEISIDRVHVVKSNWLSQCLKAKCLLDTESYLLDCSKVEHELKTPNVSGTETNGTSSDVSLRNSDEMLRQKKNILPTVIFQNSKAEVTNVEEDSDYCPSDEEVVDNVNMDGCIPSTSSSSTETSPNKLLSIGNWICAQSSKVQKENCNTHITEKLEEMVKTYESTNDKWRAFGYQKAIQALKKHPKPIATYEEAMALPGIGKRLAEKIWEIAESGELRKLNEFKSSEQLHVIEMFKDVWGAGALTARTWYQQGFRTLDDLQTKAKLTFQQKIGVKHYNDFLDRMPRQEAGEIEQVVCKAASSLLEGVIALVCGSYRRGKADCGDVDILITHPDHTSHKGFLSKLLILLKEQGFLTDDLVTAEDNGNQRKYMGVCKLPGENRRYRRIDIIVVPYEEYACALVYFTGSAHFNRSLRHLAKKMGMSLSEHSLNIGVVRNGKEKVYAGTPVVTPTEESVFLKLGVPFRPPEERDH